VGRIQIVERETNPVVLDVLERNDVNVGGCGGVRGLHLGSGSAMKLCSTRLGYLWLEAARPGPQQAEGEPSDKEGVNSPRHD
jgi:hypothetical protein